ncbi:MAG: 5'/3'-nucleotidase SurE [Chloroflexi bacterium]|nr:MAG: 5'/3'-nucleotidase SurE [Chloroflexota bacterium]
MHILVTNDDGVTAPGLFALAQTMQSFGKVSILAPDRNWSASGHVKTLHRPLRIKNVTLENGMEALACDGAPSDCVAMATLGVIDEKIDLVVSGINPGPNMGHDVTYSGTVTAAMEAVIHGIPGMAISFGEFSKSYDFSVAAEIAQKIVRTIANRLEPEMLLNVNVPARPLDAIEGMRITRQGLRVYLDELDKRIDPRGQPYYWIGGEEPTGVPDNGSDFGAIAGGYVSVTPLQLDLTAYQMAQKLSAWEWNLESVS